MPCTVRRARVLDLGQVGLAHHARVGDHGYPGDPVRGHEPLHQRDHRLGLGPVALERIDHQRHPGSVGEQPDGDLRVQAAFLGEPWLPEPIAGVGVEPQRRHVVQHQRHAEKSNHSNP
jgi:hypothetical protein